MSIEDIRDPIEIPTGPGMGWIVAVVLVVVVLGLLWWLWRRGRGGVAGGAGAAPDAVALQRLREAWLLIEQPRPFAVCVSDAVRQYLEARFGLRAPERTTEEFLEELGKSSALEASHKSLLAVFLAQSDVVKFAPDEPLLNELEEMHRAATQVVTETASMNSGVVSQEDTPGKAESEDSSGDMEPVREDERR